MWPHNHVTTTLLLEHFRSKSPSKCLIVGFVADAFGCEKCVLKCRLQVFVVLVLQFWLLFVFTVLSARSWSFVSSVFLFFWGGWLILSDIKFGDVYSTMLNCGELSYWDIIAYGHITFWDILSLLPWILSHYYFASHALYLGYCHISHNILLMLYCSWTTHRYGINIFSPSFLQKANVKPNTINSVIASSNSLCGWYHIWMCICNCIYIYM
jgi:hypothetical protein